MKICHIITALGYGGAERLLVNTVNLHCQNHEIHIIYFKGENQLIKYLDPSVKVQHIPLGFKCPRLVRQQLKKINPDIVHTHLGHADLIGLWACRRLKVKKFCTMHNIWFKWSGFDRMIFAVYQLFFRTIARDCIVICISKSVQNHVRKRLGVSPGKSPLLYNSIPNIVLDSTRIELQQGLQINPENFNILFIGRLSLQKSVATLLYAIDKLKADIKHLKVFIIGEGYELEKLQQICIEKRLTEIVEFRGVTPEPEKYFESCDIFVLPSVFEGLGIVILEAFRSKLPVIASNLEGPSELIENGENGFLFPAGNHHVLSEKIRELYENQNLRQKIALEGFKSFENKFEIRQYTDQLEKLYEKA